MIVIVILSFAAVAGQYWTPLALISAAILTVLIEELVRLALRRWVRLV
ncbi:hypothetical protein ACN27B_15255 [Micromonospora sp. WMMD754]